MLFTFLLVVHAIIAAMLVTVILMQRSEGGGLGMGGSPSGLMSARGAADFLTRATTVLATLFVLMSIGLSVLAGAQRGTRTIDTSLARPAGALDQTAAPAPAPPPAVPLAATGSVDANAAASQPQPVPGAGKPAPVKAEAAPAAKAGAEARKAEARRAAPPPPPANTATPRP